MKKVIKILVPILVLSFALSGCVQVTSPSSNQEKKSDQVETTAELTEVDTSEATKQLEKEDVEDVAFDIDMAGAEEQAAVEVETEVETEPATSTESQPCQLLLDVNFEQNIVLAKYSINVYLDGEKITMMEHGGYLLETVSTTTGTHTLRFEKRGESDFATDQSIKLDGDSTFVCSIKSHTNSIELIDPEVIDHLVDTKIEVPNLVEMRLDKAMDKLNALGFISVATQSKKTIILPSNWVVTAQSIEPGEKVDKNVEIILTCEKDG